MNVPTMLSAPAARNEDTNPQSEVMDALLRENAKLALGMQVAGLALAEVDYVTDLKHLSAEAARLFGLGDTAMAVPRAQFQMMFHPDDLALLMPRIAASLDPAGDGQLCMDHRIVRPDGEVRWLRVREQVVFDGPPGARTPVRASVALIDITARKNLAETLRASEERMHLATEATSVGIWEWNILTNEVRWDAQMFCIYGRMPTPDGIVPYSAWSSAVLPEELAQQEAALQDTIRRLGRSTRTFHILRADDHECRLIQCFEAVRTNAAGQTEWVVGTNLDITERRRANDQMRVSEIRYRRLFEAAHDGVLLLDPVTRKITDANPFMTTLLGYSRDELVGKELFEIGLLKDEAASQTMFEKLKIEHQVRYENLPLESQAGQHQDVEVAANLYDENGHAVIQCNIRDITARKKVEDALQRNEALFSALIEQAPVGVYVVDAQFRMQQINPTALPDFEKAQPLSGRNFAEIVHILWSEQVADTIIEKFHQTLLTGEAYQAPDLTAKRRDTGAEKVYEWSLQRVTLPGGEHGVVCFYNDITERKQEEKTQRRLAVLTAAHKRLEREITRRKVVEETLLGSQQATAALLVEAHQMQEEQRHLSRRLLSVQEEERKRVSRELHDVIAQSLSGINMRLALLDSHSATSPTALHDAIAETQQLISESVDAVHRFARDLRPSMLDFLGIIPALDAYISDFTKRTGIQVEVTADTAVENLGSEARTALYRIAQESLTNVDRHAGATRAEVSIHRLGEVICMDVKDNGHGFEIEGPGKSTRLGLLGMRERVEMIGGSFFIHSTPGQSTTVRVEIPVGNTETTTLPQP